MTMLLRDVSIRGTQSQDRVVGTPADRKTQALNLLRRYWMLAAGALVLLIAIIWSASAWLSSIVRR